MIDPAGRPDPVNLRRNTNLARSIAPSRRAAVRRLLPVAVAAFATIGSVACQPQPPQPPTPPPPLVSTQGPLTLATFTPDGQDRYLATSTSTSITVSAPATNTSGNLRTAILRTGAPVSVDQQSCVSFGAPTSPWAQAGVTLRVRTDAGRVRAILVTNNVIYGARAGFNVHVVDTAAASPLRQVAGMVFPATIGSGSGSLAAHPWRLCARAVGASVEVKAWAPATTPVEPAWGDAGASRLVALPAGWAYAGAAGAYLGHLAPGTRQTLTDVATAPITGTPGSASWEAALARADLANRTLGTVPAPASTVVAHAQQVTFGEAPAVAERIAASPAGRRAEAVRIHQAIHGTRSFPPASAAAPQVGVDAYVASSLAALGGGTLGDDEWTTRAHLALLRRPPTAVETEQALARLRSGVTRRTVSLELVRLPEHARLQAADAVLAVLSRPATPAEVQSYAARYAALGADGIRLRAEILVSVAPRP